MAEGTGLAPNLLHSHRAGQDTQGLPGTTA